MRHWWRLAFLVGSVLLLCGACKGTGTVSVGAQGSPPSSATGAARAPALGTSAAAPASSQPAPIKPRADLNVAVVWQDTFNAQDFARLALAYTDDARIIVGKGPLAVGRENVVRAAVATRGNFNDVRRYIEKLHVFSDAIVIEWKQCTTTVATKAQDNFETRGADVLILVKGLIYEDHIYADDALFTRALLDKKSPCTPPQPFSVVTDAADPSPTVLAAKLQHIWPYANTELTPKASDILEDRGLGQKLNGEAPLPLYTSTYPGLSVRIAERTDRKEKGPAIWGASDDIVVQTVMSAPVGSVDGGGGLAEGLPPAKPGATFHVLDLLTLGADSGGVQRTTYWNRCENDPDCALPTRGATATKAPSTTPAAKKPGAPK